MSDIKDLCAKWRLGSIFWPFKVSQSHHRRFLIHIISRLYCSMSFPQWASLSAQTTSIPSRSGHLWKSGEIHPNACSRWFPPETWKSSFSIGRADLDRLTFMSSRSIINGFTGEQLLGLHKQAVRLWPHCWFNSLHLKKNKNKKESPVCPGICKALGYAFPPLQPASSRFQSMVAGNTPRLKYLILKGQDRWKKKGTKDTGTGPVLITLIC